MKNTAHIGSYNKWLNLNDLKRQIYIGLRKKNLASVDDLNKFVSYVNQNDINRFARTVTISNIIHNYTGRDIRS
jgi:hypothetical protein